MKKIIKNLSLVFVVSASLIFLGHFFVYQLSSDSASINPGIVHAATLHESLSAPTATQSGTEWVFEVWRVAMGLANVFVAIIMFFFAFVNIAHISYDTYQLKKTLPKLIIGIILANFSMVICRMLVDIASVLTHTFVQNTPEMINGMMCALTFTPQTPVGGIVPGIIAAAGMYYFAGPLLIMFVLILLAWFIGIVILALLMFIRKSIILILTAAAPVFFVLLAFPPTESYFKKWWEWFMKWVFMGPIMIFLLWMAGKVGGECGNAFSLVRSMSTLALIYFACVVPFKLGGTVMGAVGKMGKYAATGNPYSKRKLERLSTGLQNRFARNGLGRLTKMGIWADRGRAADEQAIANNKGLREASYQQRQNEYLAKNKDEQKNIDQAIKSTKTDLENLRLEMELEIKQGNLGKVSDEFLRDINGLRDRKANAETVRKLYLDQRQKTNDMKNGMEKEESETLLLQAGVVAARNEKLKVGTGQMQKLQLNVDENGNATPTQMDYMTAMNTITNLEFMAKEHAGTPEGERYHDAAAHIREETEKYRENNQNYTAGVRINGQVMTGTEKIDYDAFKDKNLAGRQMKTMGQGMSDEVKTLQQTNSHKKLISETQPDPVTGAPHKFSNGRFSSDSDKQDDLITGNLANVGTGERIVGVEYLQAQFENAKAITHGEQKGIESQMDFEDSIQAAHNRKGTGREIKATKRHAAITKLSIPAQETMKAKIMRQAYPTRYTDDASAIAAYDDPTNNLYRGIALRRFDATKIDTSSSETEAANAREFLAAINDQYELDSDLHLSENPAMLVRQVNP